MSTVAASHYVVYLVNLSLNERVYIFMLSDDGILRDAVTRTDSAEARTGRA